MGPAKPHYVSSPPSISERKTGTSPRTGSDFPQSSSSSNTKVAPGASTSAIPPVNKRGTEGERDLSSKLRFRKEMAAVRTARFTSHVSDSNPAMYIRPLHSGRFLSTSPPLPDSQAPLTPSATLTGNAFSATNPALLNSIMPRLKPSRARLHDMFQSDEEFDILDTHSDGFIESTYMSSYSSRSVSPAFIPSPNLNWQLLSYHPARPNLSLHFDIAFPTHDIEYIQDSSCGIQRTPLSDADLDMPAADEELINMTINFQRNPSQWDIYVKRDEGIRVRDVFEAIYSAFDIPLKLYEKSLIPLHLRAGCEEAFRLRCNLAPVLPVMQRRQGWKRVDTLLYETIFCGLTQSKRGVWTLNLSGTMSKALDRRRLMSHHIARYRAGGLPWDPMLELETTASNALPAPPVLEISGEYLPPYPDQSPNALPNYSNNDLFNLPLSAAFVHRTGVSNDIVLPPQAACRICNIARLNAIFRHGTLCTLLYNIPSSITQPSGQDYIWAFFCRFAPLGALFDSPGRGPLPMIRLGTDSARLVERLEANFENPSNTMSWLHGPSGAGKSVIAYTVASHCRQKNILAGSFFFSRRHANCRNARSLVFALAYQLGLSQPQAKEKIVEALDSDPGIISPSRDLREQFARLLIEPLEAVDRCSPSRVFVIDAIDQCQDQVPELISLLTRLLSHMIEIDVGLHIFFTSRDYTKGVLIKPHLFPMISDIALDLAGITRDVRLFLHQSFNKIHKRHRLQCHKPWPPEEVLGRLVDRVGPHFITGSIIVKFVESLDHDPADRMDFIDHISFNPSSPSESSVDDFYKFIISTADDPGQAYLYLTILVNIAGMLSYSQLDDLLNRGPNQKFDMRSALSQLSPLVHTPDGPDSAVQVCHESLCDFLSDPLRCAEQFISEGVVHRLLAYSSLSVMIEELPNDSILCSLAEIVTNVHTLKDQHKTDSGALDYACTHWAHHLSLAEWDDDLRSIMTTFMRQKL
ncbi:uncharacterized protein F5147DRAFT_614412, partial [Suillus discolor]